MAGKLAGVIAGALLTALVLPAFAQQQPTGTPVRFRGTIDAVNGNTLSMTTREGEKVDIKLAENYTVTYPVPLDMDVIESNSFVGAAAVEGPDGKLQAVEVLVFPEERRGAGEGHYPWDLGPNMTMTNATVSELERRDGNLVIEVTYKDRPGDPPSGGVQEIVITPDVPIWTIAQGDASLVVPGRYVVINARKQDDGSFTAAGVSVEKDGVKPPN